MPQETLVGFVEKHERHRPDDIALHYGEQRWTWAQWAARIRQAAGALRAAGVQRGQCVAFLDKNHPGCLETLIAAVSIGAVTTIPNWRMTGKNLRTYSTTAARGCCSWAPNSHPQSKRSRPRIPGLRRIVVVGGAADEYESWLAAATPVAADPDADANDTALAIYSSGTTGRPKGRC